MNFDSKESEFSPKNQITNEQFNELLGELSKCTLLINTINEKTYPTDDDEKQRQELIKKSNELISLIDSHVEDSIQHVFGICTEVFRRAKEKAATGDPDGIKAYNEFKVLYHQMLQIQLKRKGGN